MFKFKNDAIDDYVRDLERMNKKAIPFAAKFYLNNAAFETRKIWQWEIAKAFTERNKFTRNSIRVERVQGLNMRNMQATVGSVAEYMDEQEFGGVKRSKKGKNVNIPTSYAAGQDGAIPRTKRITRPNQMRNVRLKNARVKAKTRRQRNVAAVQAAAETGHKYVFLELTRTQGIFRVLGGKRKPRIKMVHDLTRKQVIIKKKPTMQPSLTKVTPKLENLALNALQQQVERQRLFVR